MIWKGEQLQAVIFLKRGGQHSAVDVWANVFGGTPDSFQRDPNNPGASSASGAKHGFQLTIACQLGRIDFIVMPAPLGTQEEFPQIENVADALKQLSGFAAKFAAEVSPARVALVANLNLAVASATEGVTRLSELTGVKFPTGSLDPVHQFNVKSTVAPQSIGVNRLCTWSVAEAQILTVAPGGSSPIVVLARPFVNFKIDVNSIPQKVLPETAGADLFPILADMVTYIAERGTEAFA